jgi:chemotaxis protein methyltransferase CheR
MIASEDSVEAERFREVVASRLGLNFDDSKLAFLADVLKRRRDLVRQSAAVYLGRLESNGLARDELRALATDLTVNETYFFRNADQFRALALNVLPARMAARTTGAHQIRVLSAGCASGEEAYSLAIVLRENLPDPSWTVSVRAVDINPEVLEKARRARYSAWALRETQPELQRRWFSRESADFVLDRAVRDEVVFEERNLIENDPELWKPESYDIVFCRNVIMYLTPDNARSVVGRIARSLVPGGYLFLGHAETLRGLSQDFHLEHTHDTFYYRNKEASEQMREQGFRAAPLAAVGLEILPALMDDGATWVDAIRRASERIQTLSDTAQARHGEKSTATPVHATSHRAQLLDLLEKERFDDALVIARTLPAESAEDPEVLLLRAALLAHAGQFQQAEAACTELLRVDEMNAGAHYLLALCMEGNGDPAAAAEHDRVAVYLDQAFAMPRLHLGLLARRAGDRAAARLEFGRALTLLQREDASRLLLFGGGFGRDALTALCRAELIACGGKP